MLLKGKVFHGLHRGGPLIERYFYRIKGLLGFEPFKGTLNIQLEKEIDLSEYVTKKLEHFGPNGTHVIEARFIPAKLILKKDEIEQPCWIFKEENGPYRDDVIEIISDKCLEKEFGIKEGDVVEILIEKKS